jgi:hemolysin activation/secretion protein
MSFTPAWPRLVVCVKELALAGCVAAGLLAPPALAQLPPTPGAVQDSIVPQKPPAPAAPAQLVFPTTAPPVAHDPQGRRFTVNSFVFTGNTVFGQQALKRLIERYLDLQLNLYDLSRAADVVTRFYNENGYPVARAVLPAQKVEDGAVRIEVIEGRVGEVRFEGQRRHSPEFLARRLTATKPGSLITTQSLEHDLLLLNDLPGVTARAVLEPGKAFGTTDITIRIEEKLLSAFAVPNNFGLKETGQWRLDAGFTLNSPFGLGEQLSYYGVLAEDGLLRYDSLTYSLPVTSHGTRLELLYSKSDYEVGGQFTALGLDGDSVTYEARVVHPYLRSRSQNLSFNAGARQSRLRQRVFGAQVSDDKVTLGNVGAIYNQIGRDASLTNASAQVYSNNESNEPGNRADAVRLKLLLDANHLRGITRDWDLYVRTAYGYSQDPLPDSEKFSFGGPGSVRGYRPSDLRGDGGVLFTSEMRRQVPFAGMLGIAGIFYDAGVARFKAPGFVEGTVTIQSIGANVTFYPRPGIQAKLEFAVPVGNTIASDGKNGRTWFSISGSF